MYFVQVRNL